ncbi:MAG TPA: LpqB family beta-propeller domain-containing protein [Candidatus Limnocylindria bacterium]|nr:LpqB family beta-propeller domain-containing protein [Candidatus Limnocylindria bacterium]
MRVRDLIFGLVAAGLLATYLVLGSQLYAAVGPSVAPTPTPSAPRSAQPAPRVPGTIAFAIQGDVYVMREGAYSHLTSEGRNQQPLLSADGRTLYFVRREQIDGQRSLQGQRVNARLGYSSIVTKASAGGTETKVLDGLRREDRAGGFHEVSWLLSPALSPDGRRLAFLEDDGDGAADLVILDLATRQRRPLSQGADLADLSWSPDGRTVAATSYNTGVAGILLWDAERSGAARRVEALPDGDAYRASYSPDGKWIVYALRRDGRNDLHAFELATRRDVALTSDGRSWGGVFSPDGKWIAFLREQGGTIDLWAMELADALGGGSPRPATRLTKGEGVDGQSRPSWSN